jgi:hypothetical protein
MWICVNISDIFQPCGRLPTEVRRIGNPGFFNWSQTRWFNGYAFPIRLLGQSF